MRCGSQGGCVNAQACFGGSEAYRNKLKYEDLPFLLFQTGTNCLNALEAAELKDKARKEHLLDKWKTNIEKINEENQRAEMSAILPFHKDGLPTCDPDLDCNKKQKKLVHFKNNNLCGPPWIPHSQKEASLEAPPKLTGARVPTNGTSDSDSLMIAKIQDALCIDIEPKLPRDFRMSNAFPHFPFRVAGEPASDTEKQFFKYIYKSSTQLAYEDVPFDDNAYRRRVYPLNTLERSADPLVLLTYKKTTNPPTSTWQPHNLPADEYDTQLLRRDFSKGTRPIDFCAENIRAEQIATYSGCVAPKEPWMEIDNSKKPFTPLTVVRTGIQHEKLSKSCDDSYVRRLKAEEKALRDTIQKTNLDWEKKRFAEGTPELPGTYKASYSTAVPPGWSLSPIKIIEKVKPKSLWKQAVDLPEPKCFCKKSIIVEPKMLPKTPIH